MERILKAVYDNKNLSRSLRLLSHFVGVCAFALYFTAFLITVFSSLLGAVKLLAILGVSYVIVSLVRKIINAPRPYELYDFFETKPKDKKGLSFPSRHTFLVFAIATLTFPILPICSAVLFVLGAMLALARVLCGIHFIRDVLCGALLGVLCSALGLLILFPYF